MTAVLWNWIPNHSDRYPTAAHPFSVRFQNSGVHYVSNAVGWLFYASFFGIFVSIIVDIVMLYYYESKGKAIRETTRKQDEVTELHLSDDRR